MQRVLIATAAFLSLAAGSALAQGASAPAVDTASNPT